MPRKVRNDPYVAAFQALFTHTNCKFGTEMPVIAEVIIKRRALVPSTKLSHCSSPPFSLLCPHPFRSPQVPPRSIAGSLRHTGDTRAQIQFFSDKHFYFVSTATLY
jgi:hypothetical protein